MKMIGIDRQKTYGLTSIVLDEVLAQELEKPYMLILDWEPV